MVGASRINSCALVEVEEKENPKAIAKSFKEVAHFTRANQYV